VVLACSLRVGNHASLDPPSLRDTACRWEFEQAVYGGGQTLAERTARRDAGRAVAAAQRPTARALDGGRGAADCSAGELVISMRFGQQIVSYIRRKVSGYLYIRHAAGIDPSESNARGW